MMLNILYIRETFDSDDVSGGSIVARQLCKGFSHKGHKVMVISGRSNNTPEYEVIDGIEIWRPFIVKRNIKERIVFAAKLYNYVYKFIAQHNIDIVFNHAYVVTLPVTRAASKHNIPVITSVHLYCGKTWFSLTNPISAFFNYCMEIFILRFGHHDLVHSPSRKIAEKAHLYSRKQSAAIPNPVDFKDIKHVNETTNIKTIRNYF